MQTKPRQTSSGAAPRRPAGLLLTACTALGSIATAVVLVLAA